MMSAGAALAAAILDRLADFGGHAEIVAPVSRSWSSIAFAGARHRLSLHIRGEGAARAAERFRAGLDADDFSLSGHVLADIAVIGDQRSDDGGSARLTIEALTVEAR